VHPTADWFHSQSICTASEHRKSQAFLLVIVKGFFVEQIGDMKVRGAKHLELVE